jgi:hypothetical protein
MGLVHEAEDNARVARILGSNLCPQASELIVGRAALAYDTTIPASIVVLEPISALDRSL